MILPQHANYTYVVTDSIVLNDNGATDDDGPEGNMNLNKIVTILSYTFIKQNSTSYLCQHVSCSTR